MLTAPGLPSRLEAVYVRGSIALARRHRLADRPTIVIHHCALVDGTTVERDGALVVEAFETADLTNPTADDQRRVAERSERYWWAEGPMDLLEILVHGTVVVETVVQAGAD